MREIQLRLILLAALDDRVNNVSLPAFRHLFAHEIPNFPGHFAGNAPRDNGCASRRHLIQNTDIEIAVERERQRARNRRGRHHQHIRLCLIGFLHQLEALQNAEAVLLIHHHQPQAVEFHLFLNQRMGANHQLRLATVDQAARVALALLCERAGQQRNPIAARRALQQLAKAEKMLRCQNLGGRHQRRLVAVLHGHHHCL